MALKLFGMTCGSLTMDYGFALDGVEGKIVMPVPSYLIEHPKGTILFDTGLEKGLQSEKREEISALLGPHDPFVEVTFAPGEDVRSRLQACDINPEKIDYLVNSHLHLDHCGGNALIPNARLVVQKREWASACSEECIANGSYTRRHFDLGHDRLEIDGEYDLFGDGSVVCIPSYGHTAGHQSLKLKLDDGEVIITADACYLRRSLMEMRLPSLQAAADPERMLDTFRMFRRWEAAGVLLIFGHDPDQWRHLNDGPLKPLTRADVMRAACA